MIQIVQQRQRHEETTHSLHFTWEDDPGAGFSFPCDADGNVADLPEPPRNNYEMCLRGYEENGKRIVPEGVQAYRNTWTEPAIGKCRCGAFVDLAEVTNTCERCGTDYNFAGQELAPRECWGEETGEHWTECY